jgi:hypothetical protein
VQRRGWLQQQPEQVLVQEGEQALVRAFQMDHPQPARVLAQVTPQRGLALVPVREPACQTDHPPPEPVQVLARAPALAFRKDRQRRGLVQAPVQRRLELEPVPAFRTGRRQPAPEPEQVPGQEPVPGQEQVPAFQTDHPPLERVVEQALEQAQV